MGNWRRADRGRWGRDAHPHNRKAAARSAGMPAQIEYLKNPRRRSACVRVCECCENDWTRKLKSSQSVRER